MGYFTNISKILTMKFEVKWVWDTWIFFFIGLYISFKDKLKTIIKYSINVGK